MPLLKTLLAALVLVLRPLVAAAATEVVHFDLKQDGASALVTVDTPDGPRYVLIDTGRAATTSGKGAAVVRDELAKRGITRIDLLVLTHLDADHAEGTFTLLGATNAVADSQPDASPGIRGPPVRIERVLFPADTLPRHEKIRAELVASLEDSGSEILTPTADVLAQLDRDYDVTVLVPPSKPRTPNETSLLIIGHDRVKNRAFLITGDVPAGMLPQMLAQLPTHVDVLQAPHHGADPGLLQLISHTDPDYVVISANRDNRYRHPTLPVLRSLARASPSSSYVGRRALGLRVGSPGRFGVDGLARNVKQAVQHALGQLWVSDVDRVLAMSGLSRPGRLSFATPDFADGLSRRPESIPVRRPIYPERVFITGELGDLRFVDGVPQATQDASVAAFKALIWNELRDLSDGELKRLRNWDDAQAYLSILAADGQADAGQGETDPEFLPRPRWAPRVESFVASTPADVEYQPIKQSVLLQHGRSRVTSARWRQLETMAEEQIVAEREAALDRVRAELESEQDSLILGRTPTTPTELSTLIAAAVVDDRQGRGGEHVSEAVRRINGERKAKWQSASDAVSAELRLARQAEFARLMPAKGWLAPALERLGVPREYAAFSAQAVRALRRLR